MSFLVKNICSQAIASVMGGSYVALPLEIIPDSNPHWREIIFVCSPVRPLANGADSRCGPHRTNYAIKYVHNNLLAPSGEYSSLM